MKSKSLKQIISATVLAASIGGVLPAHAADGWRDLFTYSYPAQRKMKIDTKALGACFALRTKQSTVGYFFDRRFSDSEQSFNDFVEYLGASAQRKYDFATGQESRLRAWVLAQPANSIDPVSIYRASLQLNRGNIFDAVLTVHQLVRNEARYFDERRYRYKSTPEDHQAFFDRLIDIRGDLVERGPGNNGDHAGSWYRIWGTMLYELMWMPETINADQTLGIRQKVVASLGKGIGKTISQYVELSKFISPDEFDWKGKIAVDKAGAEIAHELMKDLWSKKPLQMTEQLQQDCTQKTYLVPTEKASTTDNSLLAASLPKADLVSQMSPTLKQKGGTCYAYSFTAAVEAALYRHDGLHRSLSPDYLFTRVFATHPLDSARLIKTIIGNNYEDGQIGANHSDMFNLLSDSLFTSGTYVTDEAFRPMYEAITQSFKKDSPLATLKATLKPDQNVQPAVIKLFDTLYANYKPVEKSEPALKNLHLNRHWVSGKSHEEELIPVLSSLLHKKIPPIVVFYYDLKRTQVNRQGGDSWTPLMSPILAMPVWHAVVLQKIETTKDGSTYLIFRDSYETGTAEVPNKSQIRMKVEDAPDLITQVLSVTGPWDQP